MNILDDYAKFASLAGKHDGSQVSAFQQKFIKSKQLKKYTEIIHGKYNEKDVEEEEADY
ncbi:MAG: hypothetical protein ACK4ND_01525 [Cytophagaceae bacterium]